MRKGSGERITEIFHASIGRQTRGEKEAAEIVGLKIEAYNLKKALNPASIKEGVP